MSLRKQFQGQQLFNGYVLINGVGRRPMCRLFGWRSILADWKAVRQGMLRRNNRTPLKIELHNLKDDIGEQHDVAGEFPDIVAKVRSIMDKAHTPSKLFPIRPLDTQ